MNAHKEYTIKQIIYFLHSLSRYLSLVLCHGISKLREHDIILNTYDLIYFAYVTVHVQAWGLGMNKLFRLTYEEPN